MNKCEDIRLDLVAYADRELAAEARAAVEAHIATCGACKGELRLLDATGRLLAAYDVRGATAALSATAGLSARVRDRIRREERLESGGAREPLPLRSPQASWRRALPWAVAAAVLLGGAGVAWRLGGTDPSEGAPTIAKTSTPSPRSTFVPLEPKEPLAPPTADPRRAGGALAQDGPRVGESGGPREDGAAGALAQDLPDGSGEADGAPPELLARLDVLVDLELIESMDLLEALDDPEDPTQGLDEENG